ncbi:MAG: GNAT family acetyltransferase [Actinomycetota bacterium]|jgi:ribosomal protein S18 acetylase RimI-like enzyme|nr:GNAT family acetyltransferase [Actinomycetota bacterium]
MNIRPFVRDDIEATVELWRRSDLLNPNNEPRRDIERKLLDSPWGFFVMVDEGEIIGSIMVGYDGHRGWVNYLACHPDHRRKGVATALLNTAREVLLKRGCPKINLQVRAGNISAINFYESMGYTEDQVRSFGLGLVIDG